MVAFPRLNFVAPGLHVGDDGFLPSRDVASVANLGGGVLDPLGVPRVLAQLVLTHVGKVGFLVKLRFLFQLSPR